MSEVLVQFKQLHPNAVVPTYQTQDAAGMDLHACIDMPQTIAPAGIAMVPTGLAMALPAGFEAQVRPRSGLASRHGLTLINSPGTIDADYRGEITVPVVNHGHDPFTIEPGMRIAQIVIAPVARATCSVVEDLDETARGDGGFGSTGT